MQRAQDIWGDSAYRGGRMTKLTNCSIMAPPGGARCSYATPRSSSHAPPPGSILLSELCPRLSGGAHRNRMNPWPSRLGFAGAAPSLCLTGSGCPRGSGRGRLVGEAGGKGAREGGRGGRWPWASERMIRTLIKRR